MSNTPYQIHTKLGAALLPEPPQNNEKVLIKVSRIVIRFVAIPSPIQELLIDVHNAYNLLEK